MGAYWLHDIGAALAGLPVSFYGGWETRSRSSGGFDKILGIAIHHTASKTSPASDMSYMWKSCPDRPVGNIYLARDGSITVGAAGAANTQGKGGPLSCSKGTVPKDKGNQNMIAIEAANAGTGEPWPQAQTDSYVALVRALCNHYGFDPNRDVYGHYDYCAPSCPGRKIDPAGPSPFGAVNASGTWDIGLFRAAVLGAVPVPPDPTPVPPDPGPTPPPSGWPASLTSTLPSIAKGSGDYWAVKRMQHLLAAHGYMNEGNVNNYDGVWGNGTDDAKRRFDADHGLGGGADTSCGPRSWAALCGAMPTLVKGNSGFDVKLMQHLLACCGFMNEANTSNYDGVWGNGTEQAKINHDQAAGLLPSPPSDCGPKSWTALLTL